MVSFPALCQLLDQFSGVELMEMIVERFDD